MRSFRGPFWFFVAPVVLAGVALALDLPYALPVEAYADGDTPVYLDRAYVNTTAEPALAGQRIVRLPRHLRFEIELELSEPARVTRLLSDENDNTVFADWERADALRINVPGRSCALTRAVVRSFTAGRHRLAPGGPLASAPLLVASAGEVTARTLRSWNKLSPAGDPLTFLQRNGRKLAALAFAYAGYCWLLARRRAGV